MTASPDTPGSARRRVLIVDDNTDAALSMEILIKGMGHDTRVAHGGREALEAAGPFQPDIVLLDIGMPGMNGYDVARSLRSSGHKAFIIAISGYGADHAAEQGEGAVFDRRLLKPVDFGELIDLIGQLGF